MSPDVNAVKNPSYRDVCTGRTSHVEVYDLEYDGDMESYRKLVEYFFSFHDPTTMNRQGNDRGTQYASAIFYYDENQRLIANQVKDQVQAFIDAGKIKTYTEKKVTTAIVPATVFYEAQSDHQMYLAKNPYGYCNHSFRFKEFPR